MSENDTIAILAVPCDKPVILSDEQGKKLLAEIKSGQKSKAEKERISQDVKILFTKPDTK